MCIVPRNTCTKFHLKMLNNILSYEVILKLCDEASDAAYDADDADDTDDDVKGITITRLFFFKKQTS